MQSFEQSEIQKKIIRSYVKSYNNFDIDGMIRNLDANIDFENWTNGKIDLAIIGIEVFQKQAEASKLYFIKRNQRIEAWHFCNMKVSIDVHYKATLALDLPNGMKAGDVMKLNGRSEFIIKNGKIISIKDFSEF